MNDIPTKVAAMRWLNAHVGQDIITLQARPNGSTWAPGPRTLTKASAQRWVLDGSSVVITKQHHIVEVSDFRLVLALYEEEDTLIHTTIYAPQETQS